MSRLWIPKVVLDHLGGAEIYAQGHFMGNSPEIRQRAIEDAKYLLSVNFSGYEDYNQPETRNAVSGFVRRAETEEFLK